MALGVLEARRQTIWLTPVSIFFLFHFVEMGPATIYVGYGLRTDPWFPFASTLVPAKDVAAGYLVALVGMFALHAGLEILRPGQSFNLLKTRKPKPFAFGASTVLWLLSVTAIYRPRAAIAFGMLGVIFLYGALAAMLPLAFASSRQLSVSRGAHVLLFAVGTLGLLAASAASQSSSKMAMVLAFLPLATLLIRIKRYRRWILPAATVGLFLYLALIAPSINGSRNIPTVRGLSSWDKVVQAAETHSIVAPGEPTWELLSEQYGNLMNRMFEAPATTGFMVGEVARTGLKMGNTMRDLEYAFIPRIVWPEKPTVTRGAWFDSYLGMAPREEEATASIGMTAYGEWYWNFGIVGEVAGMFAIGTLLGGLWRLAGDYPTFDPLRMILYVAVIVDAVMLPEASSVLVTMTALYLMFGGIAWFRSLAGTRLGSARNITRGRGLAIDFHNANMSVYSSVRGRALRRP